MNDSFIVTYCLMLLVLGGCGFVLYGLVRRSQRRSNARYHASERHTPAE
jgi:hypothetical protein